MTPLEANLDHLWQDQCVQTSRMLLIATAGGAGVFACHAAILGGIPAFDAIYPKLQDRHWRAGFSPRGALAPLRRTEMKYPRTLPRGFAPTLIAMSEAFELQ